MAAMIHVDSKDSPEAVARLIAEQDAAWAAAIADMTRAQHLHRRYFIGLKSIGLAMIGADMRTGCETWIDMMKCDDTVLGAAMAEVMRLGYVLDHP
jgi:hypothetical protein